MDNPNNTVWTIEEPKYSVLFNQDFTLIDVDNIKPANQLPNYKDKPQIINQVMEDGQSCLYLQTDGNKFERHGIILAENISIDGDMTIEIKMKPIGDSEGVGELWLINEDGSKWINFKLYGGYYGMKRETVASFHGENVYLPSKLWDWGSWYYLHIQLGKEKTVMALLDENRYVLARHCFEKSVSSLLDTFSMAISQEMGMLNSRSNQMKTYITDIKVGQPLNYAQDLMSIPTTIDRNITEIENRLKDLHTVKNRKDQYDSLIGLLNEYRTYEPKIEFYFIPLIKEFILFYNLPELLETIDNKDDTFGYFNIINKFENHSTQALTEALNRFGNYPILKSKFYKEYSQDVNQVIYQIYIKLHKQSFFQKLFGDGALLPYDIFKASLFGNELDENINLKNEWQEDYYNAAFHKKTKIKLIGEILKTIDSLMRSFYGYPQSIEKPKIYKSYDTIIETEINKFCTEHMKFNSYVKKEKIRKEKSSKENSNKENSKKGNTKKKEIQDDIPMPIEIDVSKLDEIRIAAEDIQRRLIIEDEKHENRYENRHENKHENRQEICLDNRQENWKDSRYENRYENINEIGYENKHENRYENINEDNYENRHDNNYENNYENKYKIYDINVAQLSQLEQKSDVTTKLTIDEMTLATETVQTTNQHSKPTQSINQTTTESTQPTQPIQIPNTSQPSQPDFISELQTQLIQAILQKDKAKTNKIMRENGYMLSIVVDEINEKLFDHFHDNCIEFIAEEPTIVEDYVEELKGIIKL